jgi:AraC-like DNA-binding protein
MLKRTRPAVDDAIASLNGVTRDGQPMSYNRSPVPDLAPWIARLYAIVMDAPPGHRLNCGIFNDTTMIRIQLSGKWSAQTIRGPMAHGRAAMFFGPQSHLMPVSVTGSFISVGISLRPGVGHAVMGLNAADFLDVVMDCEELGLPGNAALAALEESTDPETWLQTLEAMIRIIVERVGRPEPDPITARFENVAFANPSINVADFAHELGVEQRRLERIIRRDFGMAPKQVLRRARALDMASHLRGVADQSEAEELTLRYYDQSHLIREFIELFGMSPSQFVATPQPILTLALESRQARRLEMMDRLSPGGIRPWL